METVPEVVGGMKRRTSGRGTQKFSHAELEPGFEPEMVMSGFFPPRPEQSACRQQAATFYTNHVDGASGRQQLPWPSLPQDPNGACAMKWGTPHDKPRPGCNLIPQVRSEQES